MAGSGRRDQRSLRDGGVIYDSALKAVNKSLDYILNGCQVDQSAVGQPALL